MQRLQAALDESESTSDEVKNGRQQAEEELASLRAEMTALLEKQNNAEKDKLQAVQQMKDAIKLRESLEGEKKIIVQELEATKLTKDQLLKDKQTVSILHSITFIYSPL